MRISLPNDFKFMGPIKQYELSGNVFKKTYQVESRISCEIKGNNLAGSVGIPVVPIIELHPSAIAFETVSYPRLDQVFVSDIDLSLVHQAGALLGLLHYRTRTGFQPDLAIFVLFHIQFEREELFFAD